MPIGCKMSHKTHRLYRSTAIGRMAIGLAAGAVAGGYGRIVEAGTCAPISGFGTYLCTGPANLFTDVTQSIGPVADDLTIVSVPGFGLDTSLSGGDGFAVRADGDLGSDDVTIVTGDVTAARTGIAVSGSGDDIRIDTTAGAIRGVAGNGIDVDYSSPFSGDVTLLTSDISAAETAIEIATGGAKTIDIDTTDGTVTGGNGLAIYNRYAREKLQIKTADVFGDIETRADSEIVKIDTSLGTVNGRIRSGALSGAPITITTANVSGWESGILAASSEAGGDVRIDTTAGKIGRGDDEREFGTGIRALASNNGSIVITSADVSSRQNGIRSNIYKYDPGDEDYDAFGDITIDTTLGKVLALGGDGITAATDYINYGDIDIVASDVTGAQNGIRAGTYGSGVIKIDSTMGSVSALGGRGISVSGILSGDISVTAAAVSGSIDGISIRRMTDVQDGEIIVDTTKGSVNGTSGAGIEVRQLYGSESVVVRTSDVTGGRYGIRLDDAEIPTVRSEIDTSEGTITARQGSGIYIGSYGGEVEIDAFDIVAMRNGIMTRDSCGELFSCGNISIDTTAGSIRVETGDGIQLDKWDEVFIRTGNITAGGAGISVYSAAEGTSIEVMGEIDGAIGIDMSIPAKPRPTRLATSGLIQGRDGVAIDLTGTSSAKVEIFDQLAGQSSATQGIIGRSFLGEGDDTLSFIDTTGPTNILYDGVFASLFDGGLGTDRAEFSVGLDNLIDVGGSGAFVDLFFSDGGGENALLSLVNFEDFTFSDDPSVSYDLEELRGLGNAVAPIPLPPSIALLGGAILLAGSMRARRRKACHQT